MKYSTKYSDAIHILAYIEMLQGTDLSSDRIAQSVETNPAYVRRIMSDLRQAGLIESKRGKADPKLLKKPEEITLLDIYSSIEKDQRLLHIDQKTNPNCVVGGSIQGVLDDTYDRLQKNVELEMQQITLADIIGKLNEANK
jgi:Rrf2 family protein